MGKILFLDDMEWRHSEFMKRSDALEMQTWQARTASEAISLLKNHRFDQVFLDHDLSDDDIMIKVREKSKAPTGMTVVDHIMTMEDPPMDVIVHSCNGPAAIEMAYRLAEHPAKIRVRRLAFPELLRAIDASAIM